MALYKLTTFGAFRASDNLNIPSDPLNTDWQAYQTWLAAGNEPEAADPVAVPARHLAKLTIVDRLIAAGLISQALAAMNADVVLKARWDAAAQIDAEDATVKQFLTAIGADPIAILAP